MGDSQATSEAATLNFNMRKFYEKWLQDMRDDQVRNETKFTLQPLFVDRKLNGVRPGV